jgi:hypothetical protein
MTNTTANNKKQESKEDFINNPQRGGNGGMAGHTPPAQATLQKRGGD